MHIYKEKTQAEQGKRANVPFEEKKVQGRLNGFQKKSLILNRIEEWCPLTTEALKLMGRITQTFLCQVLAEIPGSKDHLSPVAM